MKNFWKILAVCAVMQVTGCTLIPRTANLDVPVTKSGSVAATGPAVKIVSVTDSRKFVWPHEASDCETPSVDGEKMLKDTATKARAFSRYQRCEAGEWAQHAMVMVPEGQTVADVVKKAVATGFEEAGYRVVSASDPNALPVKIDIKNFWVSRQLDGMGVRYETYIDLDMMAGDQPIAIREDVSEKFYWEMLFDSYQKYAEAGLTKISELTAQRLRNTQ